MDEYTAEITEPIRQEVKVHGTREVAERTGLSEECLQEIASREAAAYDQAFGTNQAEDRTQ